MARDERSLFDPTYDRDHCARRHGNAAGSVEGFQLVRGRLNDRCLRIMHLVRDAGERGLLLDDAVDAMVKPPNVLSGLFTHLRSIGMIYVTGRRPARSGVRSNVYKTTPDGERWLAGNSTSATQRAGGNRR
jgi:hypothetical protein